MDSISLPLQTPVWISRAPQGQICSRSAFVLPVPYQNHSLWWGVEGSAWVLKISNKYLLACRWTNHIIYINKQLSSLCYNHHLSQELQSVYPNNLGFKTESGAACGSTKCCLIRNLKVLWDSKFTTLSWKLLCRLGCREILITFYINRVYKAGMKLLI